MTISSTTNRLVFAGPGNGFAYNKPVFARSGSDLYVLIEQTDGTLLEPTLDGGGTYDFTISGSYDAASFRYPAGVTVTLNTALPSGWTIAIECRPPNTQSSDYTDGGPLPAERLETDLDRLTVMMQTVQGQAGDAVRISPTASGFSNDPIVPAGGRILAFNGAGTAFTLLVPNTSAYITLPLAVAEGGTGATTILGAQQALDLEPGVDVQAYDAALADIAGLTLASGDILYVDGSGDIVNLAKGTDGQVLTLASGLPDWDDAATPASWVYTESALSGTAVDFTSLPSGIKQIRFGFTDLARNSTSNILIQLGDSGGFETSGYVGGFAGVVGATTGISLTSANASSLVLHGILDLVLNDASSFKWAAGGSLGRSDTATTPHSGGYTKALSAELTQLRITCADGTSTLSGRVVMAYLI
jgi:hypothetical protein